MHNRRLEMVHIRHGLGRTLQKQDSFYIINLTTIASLQTGEVGFISEESLDKIPLKLLEMGCLPGNEVELVQIAPFKDPMYLNVNGSHLAIRRETASFITVEKLSHE